MRSDMERASEELERRSRYLSSLILLQQRHKLHQHEQEKRNHVVDRHGGDEMTTPNQNQSNEDKDATFEVTNKKDIVFSNVRVRASDMPPELQKRAFCCAHQALESMPKLHSKRLSLALKKEFDTSYGPAWHCIVGTSFGSYVTHSLGGFLYFSIDKVYILLFRTAVEHSIIDNLQFHEDRMLFYSVEMKPLDSV